MSEAVKRLRRKIVRVALEVQAKQKALQQHERVEKAQKRVSDALAKAKRNLSRQQEVTADHMCGIFRDALETRQVIPRGARLPNGQGKPRRLYRESCDNPGTTPLKRMRCARACCRSYTHSPGFKAKSISRGSKNAMCSGVTCKIPRRPPGSKGKSTFLGSAAGSSEKRARSGEARKSRAQPAPKRPRTKGGASRATAARIKIKN